MARHASSSSDGKPFDYIILETSGLADPGNLVPLFWVDEGLGSGLYLDGVVTLVDAGNLVRSLEEPSNDEKATPTTNAGGHSAGEEEADKDGGQTERTHETVAHRQLATADVIVLNKCDNVPSKEDLTRIEARVRSINGLAKIHRTAFSQIPQLETFLLDLHAYDGFDAVDIAARNTESGHSHLDPTIGTVTIPFPGPFSDDELELLENWLRALLWEGVLLHGREDSEMRDFEVHRTKGRVIMQNGKNKIVQGVREVFEIIDDDSGKGNAEGRLVFIGRGLNREEIEASLSPTLGQARSRRKLSEMEKDR